MTGPLVGIPTYYNDGTATVTVGSATVAGQGTQWLANAEPGDRFITQSGQSIPILSVDTDTSLTLLWPWQGTAQASQVYAIERVTDAVRLENYSQRLVNLLLSGFFVNLGALDGTGGNKLIQLLGPNAPAALPADKLLAINALELVANKLLYATGSNTFDVTDFAASARALLALVAAADKLPYFNGENTAALADFRAAWRAALGLPVAANKGLYFTDENTPATFDLTAFARSLLDDANAAAARATLGAQAALGFTPVNKGGDTGVGALSTSAPLTVGGSLRVPHGMTGLEYSLDISGAVLVTVGAGAPFILHNFSGMFIVNNLAQGGIAIYVGGGGSINLLGGVGTHETSATYASGQNGYAFFNNAAVARPFLVMSFRTRSGA